MSRKREHGRSLPHSDFSVWQIALMVWSENGSQRYRRQRFVVRLSRVHRCLIPPARRSMLFGGNGRLRLGWRSVFGGRRPAWFSRVAHRCPIHGLHPPGLAAGSVGPAGRPQREAFFDHPRVLSNGGSTRLQSGMVGQSTGKALN